MASRYSSLTPSVELDHSSAKKIIFFGGLLIYTILLMSDIPEGPSGVFPTLVVPIIGTLVLYRLATIVYTDQTERLGNVIDARLNLSSVDLLSADSFFQDEGDADYRTIEVVSLFLWVTAAVGIVYLAGHVAGGFVFMFAFLYLYGGISLVKSLGLTAVITFILIVIVRTLNLAVWSGELVRML